MFLSASSVQTSAMFVMLLFESNVYSHDRESYFVIQSKKQLVNSSNLVEWIAWNEHFRNSMQTYLKCVRNG